MPRAQVQLQYQYVGHRVIWEPQVDLEILCRVLDARSAYGREELLVTPVLGVGQTWVITQMVTYLADEDTWPENSRPDLLDAASDLVSQIRKEGPDFIATLPTKVRIKMIRLDEALEPETAEAQ